MDNISDKHRVIVRASWVSVAGNAFLALLKIGTGVAAGSLAVLGDGIDSATDVVISLVTLYTAHITNRPPDRKYAYGYERADSIAAKLLSFIVFIAGLQMIIASGRNIMTGAEREMPAMWAVWATVVSMAGKSLLAWYQFSRGRKAGSSMLIANAKNLRSDVMLSGGVLLGLAFTFVFKMPVLDAVTSLAIGLLIIRTAVGIFRETSLVLMDGMEDPDIYRKIFEAVDKVPGALNPHRVRSRQIGNMCMIDMDIEVNGDMPLREAHKIAQQVEDSIKASLGNVYDIVIHIEPEGVSHKDEEFGMNPRMMKEDE